MATKRVTFAGPSEDDGEQECPDEIYSANVAKKRKAIRKGAEDDEDEFTFDADADKRKNDDNAHHTLDSDEEDDEKYEKLDVNKIHGQEEGTEDYEGNVKITAFNMKEDMEDGHFDSSGNFIFNKTEEIKDGWLDNIDWTQVKRRAGKNWQKVEDEKSDDDEPDVPNESQQKEMYEKLLPHLKPNETIMSAIKRIGAQRLSAAEERKRRWAAKKAGKEIETDQTKVVNEISGLADALISQGHAEAYQFKREKIEQLLQTVDRKTTAVDSLDMFGDEEAGPSSTAAASTPIDEAVMWEYKLTEDAEVKGPFTTAAIMKLKDSDSAVAQAFARRNPTMKLSATQQKVISNSVDYVRIAVQWGFVPAVVYLGFSQGPDALPNGEIPQLSIFSLLWG